MGRELASRRVSVHCLRRVPLVGALAAAALIVVVLAVVGVAVAQHTGALHIKQLDALVPPP